MGCSAPDVHDGDVVRIDALPVRQAVEQCDRRRARHQQGHADFVLVEQAQKIGQVLQVEGAIVPQREGRTVSFRASVDEGRNPDEVEIAAKTVFVEDRSALGDVK